MSIPLTGKFTPSAGPGAFKLYDAADIDTGTLDKFINLISGGRIAASGIAGEIIPQTGAGVPSHSATRGTMYWNTSGSGLYVNNNGTTGWSSILGSGVASHFNLTNIGTNTHAQIDTHIAATGTSVHGLGALSILNSITDRALLPSAIAYEDEANTFSQQQSFTYGSLGQILVGSASANASIGLRSMANANNYYIIAISAPSADRELYIPDCGGNATLATIDGTQTFTAGTWSATKIAVAKGGTNLTTIPALSTLVANSLDTYTTITPGAGNSIRINAGGTAWEAYTPGIGGSGVTSVGALDDGTEDAKGANISGTTLYMQSATGTYPGLVTTEVQTLAGAKTFTSDMELYQTAGVDLTLRSVDNSLNSSIIFKRAEDGETQVVTNDVLGHIKFLGYGVSSYTDAGVLIEAVASGQWTGSNAAADLRFYTTPLSSITRQLVLTLGQNKSATFVGAVIASGLTLTTDLSVENGGTGASTASDARTNLGAQTYDATLQSISALGTVADKTLYTTALDTWAETSLTSFGRTLIDDADASAGRTTLGLVIGTNVQAYDADLTTWAGITPGSNVGTALAIAVGTDGAFIVKGGVLGTPSSGTLTNTTGLPEGGLSLTDITTNNASTSNHGFLKKLDNTSTNFMNGAGNWAVPVGTTYTGTANQVIVTGTVLSTPQNINTTANVDFNSLVLASGLGIGGAVGVDNSLTLYGTTSGSVTFKTVAAVTTSSYTLPINVGVSGQALTTDGIGQMYWASGGVSLSNANTWLATQTFKSGSDTLVPVKIQKHSISTSANFMNCLASDGATILCKIDSSGTVIAAGFLPNDMSDLGDITHRFNLINVMSNSTTGGLVTGDVYTSPDYTALYFATPSGSHSIKVPPYSGTVAVSASGNIVLNSTTGNITFTGTLPLANGGTSVSTIAAGSILVANTVDTLSALTSISGTKILTNTAGTISWETGGAVTSVTANVNGTLTISPTTGAVVAGINLSNANIWLADQEIFKNSNANPVFVIRSEYGSDRMSRLSLKRALMGPTTVTGSSYLGVIDFWGYETATYYRGSYILATTTQTWTDVAHGANLAFYTTPNESTSNAVALTLNHDQSATFASTVTATTFVGALTGAATTASTVTTAAQPNITSLGTLTSLAISGTALGLNVTNTTDTASIQLAVFQGDRATPADGDEAYFSFKLSDSAGNQDEGARITWKATTVLNGATQDTDLIFSALVNNSLTTMLTLDGSASEIVPAVNINSAANITGATITANTGFTGTLTGNASTATLASTVTVADAASDTSCWVILSRDQSGSLALYSDAGLTYNSSTNALTATTFYGAVGTASQGAITSVGVLTSLAISGNLIVDTTTLYVDATANKVGIGLTSPQYHLHVRDASLTGWAYGGIILHSATSGTTYHYVEGNDGYGVYLQANKTGQSNPSAMITLNNAASTVASTIIFSTGDGTGAITERIRLIAGNLLIGTTTDGMTAAGSLAIAQDFAHRGTYFGVYNVTPIVRPTTAVAAATFVQAGGTAVNDNSTFDGYKMTQVVKALRNLGILT